MAEPLAIKTFDLSFPTTLPFERYRWIIQTGDLQRNVRSLIGCDLLQSGRPRAKRPGVCGTVGLSELSADLLE